MEKKKEKTFHTVETIPQYIIETGVNIDTPNIYSYRVSRNLFQNGNVEEISYTYLQHYKILYTSNSEIDVVMSIIIIIFIFSFLNRIPLICSINKMSKKKYHTVGTVPISNRKSKSKQR
jgi:hypothetical protein